MRTIFGVEIQQPYEIQSHPEYVKFGDNKFPLPIYLDFEKHVPFPKKILLGTRIEYRGQVLSIVWTSQNHIEKKSCSG